MARDEAVKGIMTREELRILKGSWKGRIHIFITESSIKVVPEKQDNTLYTWIFLKLKRLGTLAQNFSLCEGSYTPLSKRSGTLAQSFSLCQRSYTPLSLKVGNSWPKIIIQRGPTRRWVKRLDTLGQNSDSAVSYSSPRGRKICSVKSNLFAERGPDGSMFRQETFWSSKNFP